ncbi:MAG: acyl-CoA thioesterase [Calditrichaeota bacterium]|nr:MAG: acyl-CoA thioesterase [Calditrichota bacterium]
MDLEERINRSESHIVRTIFPNTTNHRNTLFGGTALSWMDEIAFITATRFCRQPLVTVSIDKTDFKKPIPSRTIADIIGRVVKVGRTSLQVKVDIYIEQMDSDHRELAIEGLITMVAVDDDMKPVPIKQ